VKLLLKVSSSYSDHPKAYEDWYEYREKSERKHADVDCGGCKRDYD